MAAALCRNSGSDWKSRSQQSGEPSQKNPRIVARPGGNRYPTETSSPTLSSGNGYRGMPRDVPVRVHTAEAAGSKPAAPTTTDNILRACYAPFENLRGRWVREKSVRSAARLPRRPMFQALSKGAGLVS
jgi:hypothetical protein